jgi:hypothetical protein
VPSAHAILAGLAAIANDWRWLAISWHASLAVFFAAVLTGWRPSVSILGYLLVAPLLSVSLVGWLSDNPFNGASFGILVAVLVATTIRLPRRTVRLASPGWVALGVGLVSFGWTYPHFVATDSWTTYVYASPFGLLPCPTLAVVLGTALIFRNLASSTWTATLAIAGFFYGAFGVFRLGVALDWGLLLASGTLAGAMVREVAGRRSSKSGILTASRQ